MLTVRQAAAAVTAAAVAVPVLYVAAIAAYIGSVDLYYATQDGSWVAVLVRSVLLAALIGAPLFIYRRLRERNALLSNALLSAFVVAFVVSIPLLALWSIEMTRWPGGD